MVVGLVHQRGKTQWAVSAKASSTFANYGVSRVAIWSGTAPSRAGLLPEPDEELGIDFPE